MTVTELRQRLSGRTTNPETALTTELNSLANNTASSIGSAISNDGSTELDTHAEAEIVLASLTPVAPAYIEVWLVPTIDGTNYADTGYCVASIAIATGTAAKREVSARFPVPARDHKFKVINRTGVSLGSSGNTLKINYVSGGSGS